MDEMSLSLTTSSKCLALDKGGWSLVLSLIFVVHSIFVVEPYFLDTLLNYFGVSYIVSIRTPTFLNT